MEAHWLRVLFFCAGKEKKLAFLGAVWYSRSEAVFRERARVAPTVRKKRFVIQTFIFDCRGRVL